MKFNLNNLINYLKESRKELKKVAWPTRRETLRHTLIVVGISLGMAVFLGAIDFLLTYGLEQII